MDGADLDLFERSLRHAIERSLRHAIERSLRDATEPTGAALDAALDELGWRNALQIDSRAAVSLLFELQGASNVTSSALDQVVLDAIGIDHHTPSGLVLPALDRSTPPCSLDGDRLTVAGMGTAALATHETAVVVASTHGADVSVVVPTAELTLRPVGGLDPWLGLIEVRGDSIEIRATPQPLDGWTTAVALAQRAVSHELVGAARTMLEQAREHALERVQFGQPIGRFQAVRHRLADTLVAIETADAALDAAWLDRSPQTAAMAKALAGRAARTASRHCQQVLAGIGFTTEHPLHRYIRRVLVLDELFGSARSLTRELGDDLLATRQLPALLPL